MPRRLITWLSTVRSRDWERRNRKRTFQSILERRGLCGRRSNWLRWWFEALQTAQNLLPYDTQSERRYMQPLPAKRPPTPRGSVGEEPTARELQVLRLICEGFSTKDVAASLGISVKTASNHRLRLMEKAGVGNAVQLLHWALKNGHS